MMIAVRAIKRDDVCEFVCELLRMGSQEGLYEGADKGTLGVVIKEKHLHPFLWEGNTQCCTIRQPIVTVSITYF